MTFAEFHDALRIIRAIDRHECPDAFVDAESWARFARDPFHWFIQAPHDKAALVWAVITMRQYWDNPELAANK